MRQMAFDDQVGVSESVSQRKDRQSHQVLAFQMDDEAMDEDGNFGEADPIEIRDIVHDFEHFGQEM